MIVCMRNKSYKQNKTLSQAKQAVWTVAKTFLTSGTMHLLIYGSGIISYHSFSWRML